MFDIGWSEMMVILLVALVVIGPRDLPRVARSVGRWVAKGRAMAREFQSALEDMAREAELDKVKSEIEKAGRTNFAKTIENTIDPTGELGKAFDPNAKVGSKAVAKTADAKPAAPREITTGTRDDAAKEVPEGATPEAAKRVTPVAPKKPAAPKESKAGPKAKGPVAAATPTADTPAAAAPADPGPAVSGQQEAAAGRQRTKAPEREAVPADPS